MTRWRELWRRTVNLVRRARLERGLTEEIEFHLQRQIEKNLRAGLTPDEARRQALVRFGGVEQAKEQTRDEFRTRIVEDFGRDMQWGARALRRAPGFAMVSILTLGLGIGAAAAVFSVVNGVLLEPLPYPDADRVVRLFQLDSAGRRLNFASEPNFVDWKTGTRSFRFMAEMQPRRLPVVVGREPAVMAGALVSREFFDVLGVYPSMGRGFAAEELRMGGPPAALVSYRFWQSYLGGAPLEGQVLQVGDHVHQIVGVMPQTFRFPADAEFWIPRELNPPQLSRTAHNFQVVARIAGGVSLAAARADISGVSRALKTRYGDDTWMSDAAAVPLLEQMTASSRATVLMLFAAAVMLLVIACLNVSNLLLARVATRRREMAVRAAIGAGRFRIARQLLAEALVLCVAGGVVGVALAYGGIRALAALPPLNLARLDNVDLDWPVLAFAVAAVLVAAIGLTIAATFRAGRDHPRESLTASPRAASAGGATWRVRETLSIAQVALTLVLLVGAGLLTRSFARVLTVDPGYRVDGLLILDLTVPASPGTEPARSRHLAFQEELLARLRDLAGVDTVALVNEFPLGGQFYANGQFLEMNRPDEIATFDDFRRFATQSKERTGSAGFRIASEEYFAAMGIPLIRGRLFEAADGPDSAHVAVVSESLARARWPNQDPLGRFIQFGNMDGDLRGFRIVGVVGDVREITREAQARPLFYGYSRQRVASSFSVVIRTDTPESVTPAAQEVARELGPRLPMQVRRIEDALDRTLTGRRFSLMVIAMFSVTALVLAVLGVYGLIAFVVTQRTREIGIRVALGASAREVLMMIVGRGLAVALIGTVVGAAAALALTRLVEGQLFGVSVRDPFSFVAVTAVTVGAVVIASYLPARRALKVPPVDSLRSA